MANTIPRLTRNDLRLIDVGATKAFQLPNAKACNNGKSMAYQFQHDLGCKFSIRTDYNASTLTITRLSI
jgi:hypothetical protein